MNEHLPVISFLLPFATAICMPMVGLKARGLCRPLALTAALAMFVVSVINLFGVLEHGETRYAFSGWPISTSLPDVAPLGIEWVNDGLASVMLVALSFLGWLCLFYGGPVAPQSLDGRVVHYYVLILLIISGLTGIVLAGDIFNVFVFLEVAALSAYALVGISGGRALIAAFRYLILGSLGASFYLLGVVFIYATTGTLNMADIAQQIADKPEMMTSKAVIGGTTFMFIGFGIKMALFPLHGWLPGAYTRAPDAISPLLAALMTKVALYGWVRIMFWGRGRDRAIPLADASRRSRLSGCRRRSAVGTKPGGRETNVRLRRHLARGLDPDRREPGKSNRVRWQHVLFDQRCFRSSRVFLLCGSGDPPPRGTHGVGFIQHPAVAVAHHGNYRAGAVHDRLSAHRRIFWKVANHPRGARSGQLPGSGRRRDRDVVDDGLFPTFVCLHFRRQSAERFGR